MSSRHLALLFTKLAEPLVFAKPVPVVTYVHHDVFGNTVARTDAAGAPVWTARPDPFGNVTPSTKQHAVRYANKLGEYGWTTDGTAYPMGARLYLPYLGRFGAADPLGFDKLSLANPQSFNRYIYALNNPFRYQDPTGLVSREGLAVIREIIHIVMADAEMRLRVGGNDYGVDFLFSSGWARNTSYMAGRGNEWEADAAACTGIADQGVHLISLAVAEGRLPNVELVGEISRKQIAYHTAFYVKLKSGEEIVLDWHQTLNIALPVITTPQAWCSWGSLCQRPVSLEKGPDAKRAIEFNQKKRAEINAEKDK